jgi:hypothetical protein
MLQLHVPIIHVIVADTDTIFGLYSGSVDNVCM